MCKYIYFLHCRCCVPLVCNEWGSPLNILYSFTLVSYLLSFPCLLSLTVQDIVRYMRGKIGLARFLFFIAVLLSTPGLFPWFYSMTLLVWMALAVWWRDREGDGNSHWQTPSPVPALCSVCTRSTDLSSAQCSVQRLHVWICCVFISRRPVSYQYFPDFVRQHTVFLFFCVNIL